MTPVIAKDGKVKFCNVFELPSVAIGPGLPWPE